MSDINELAKTIVKAVSENENKKPSPYDTVAEIKRIEGSTAWVRIPGGVDETPVALTIDAKEGDSVMVRVSGGRAWITGNSSAPPTDDTRANVAVVQAVTANETAITARKEAYEKPNIFYGSPEDSDYTNSKDGDYLVDGETGNTYKKTGNSWEIVTDIERITDTKIDSLNSTVFYAYSEILNPSDIEDVSFDNNNLQYRGIYISTINEPSENPQDYSWSLNPEWARKYADNYIEDGADNSIIIKSPDPETYSKLHALAMLFYMGGIEQLRIGYDENRETYGVVTHDIFMFGNGAGLRFDNSADSDARSKFIFETRNNGHLSLKMY